MKFEEIYEKSLKMKEEMNFTCGVDLVLVQYYCFVAAPVGSHVDILLSAQYQDATNMMIHCGAGGKSCNPEIRKPNMKTIA